MSTSDTVTTQSPVLSSEDRSARIAVTVFPLLMGLASDAAKASGLQHPQTAAAVVMAVGVAYLLSYIPRVKQQ